MDDKTSKAVELLQKHLDEIIQLRKSSPYSASHMRWLINVDFNLARIFGAGPGMHATWKNIPWQWTGNRIINGWEDANEVIHSLHLKAYIGGLDIAEGILLSAIDQLKQVGLDGIEKEELINA